MGPQGYLNDFLKEKLLNKNATSLAEAMINVMLDTMLEVDLLKAEWERKELKKRQEEGIKRAIAKGVKFGRKKNNDMRIKFENIYPLTRNKDASNYIPMTKALDIIGCSKAMFYKMKKERDDENGV